MMFWRWWQEFWWARQRAIDLRVLWPACKQQTKDLDHARAVFAVHAFNDPAWVRHYQDRLWSVINQLK